MGDLSRLTIISIMACFILECFGSCSCYWRLQIFQFARKFNTEFWFADCRCRISLRTALHHMSVDLCMLPTYRRRHTWRLSFQTAFVAIVQSDFADMKSRKSWVSRTIWKWNHIKTPQKPGHKERTRNISQVSRTVTDKMGLFWDVQKRRRSNYQAPCWFSVF